MDRPSNVVLVIEGGGSKGRAALAWDGRIAARCLPAGLNPNDIGPECFRQRAEALLLPLLDLPGRPIGSLRVIAALAGAGRPGPRRLCAAALKAILKPRVKRFSLKVTSDAEALLDRFFYQRDGVVLIAGTGSICLGARHTGNRRVTARAGGRGFDLDQGSGFSLGLGLLDTAIGALEGRVDGAYAVDLLCERYGLRPDEIRRRFLPVRRDQVAALARIALEASSRGYPLPRRLVREAVAALAGMVRAVADRLGLDTSPDVVIAGGLFENPHFRGAFERALRRSLPSASLTRVEDPLACLISGQRAQIGSETFRRPIANPAR
jgi:N-acetylglucosamine kinase-like BadF-type ATPase